jgi:hypothetical protein
MVQGTRHSLASDRFGTGRLFVVGVCLLLACVFVLGCGGSSAPFELVKVKGKVVYEDGTPLTSGKVYFRSLQPPQDGITPRAGAADINGDGTFDTATTYKYGDGIIRGKHKVAIMQAFDAKGNSLVPQKYEDMASTPLTIDTDDAPLVIKVPKP